MTRHVDPFIIIIIAVLIHKARKVARAYFFMSESVKKILLADDDALIAGVYNEALKAAGFSVELAFDGEQAIEKLEAMHASGDMPALMLLDMMMPKKNGLEVLVYIKQKTALKNMPVIMLTNLGDATDVERALEAGAVMYLVKVQHTPREVVAKVREVAEAYAKDRGSVPLVEASAGDATVGHEGA